MIFLENKEISFKSILICYRILQVVVFKTVGYLRKTFFGYGPYAEDYSAQIQVIITSVRCYL